VPPPRKRRPRSLPDRGHQASWSRIASSSAVLAPRTASSAKCGSNPLPVFRRPSPIISRFLMRVAQGNFRLSACALKDTVFVAKIRELPTARAPGVDQCRALCAARVFAGHRGGGILPCRSDWTCSTRGNGRGICCVVDVLNFGGGDILEIARASGGETVFLPFKKEIFPRINLMVGSLTIVPPIETEAKPACPES